ncbi:hypothetical protein [Paenibacillus sinopodophylli]|uniref:hypothetical protein n=1 Tax=Paenibacillus sinopodophylli TaxID=1837342 RepID=UPI00110D1DCE|nr:hypothetical protein [Paenibacillus sinopodophylli]
MANKDPKEENLEVVEAPSSFPKRRWLISARFIPQEQDVLSVALLDGKEYTFDEAKAAVNKFLKAEVL